MKPFFMEKNISIKNLQVNSGQIEGLPKNPRFIKDNRFEALKKSIQDAPEMLDYRKLLVVPFNGKYVVICGNMRFRACKELGYKEMPCYILDENTPVEKLREYAIKDNVSFGNDDYDLISNEWDEQDLADFGFEWQGVEDVKTIEEGEEDEEDSKLKDNQFIVEVICSNEKEQNDVFSKLDSQGYEVRLKFK